MEALPPILVKNIHMEGGIALHLNNRYTLLMIRIGEIVKNDENPLMNVSKGYGEVVKKLSTKKFSSKNGLIMFGQFIPVFNLPPQFLSKYSV